MGIMKSTRFYDLNVHALPDYADSLSRMVLEAKDLGYSGICVTSHNPENKYHHFEIPPQLARDFEVYLGIEIDATRANTVRREVNRLREKVDIILIDSTNEEVIRSAVEEGRVDILAHPASLGKPLNHVLAKAAADNGVSIDFSIEALTTMRGNNRVKILSAMRQNIKLARKYNVQMIITSGARSHYDLRTPREMISLAMIMGMTQKEALIALSATPQNIIRRNTDKKRIMDGVEVII